MAYVRERIAPASSDRARERRDAYRISLAPGANQGDRFQLAYDWFREALVYAKRRSYLSLALADRGQARRLQIIAEAAAAVQAAGCAIDDTVPHRPATRVRRHAIRGGHDRAPVAAREIDKPLRLYAAAAWLMYGLAQADRHVRRGGDPEVKSAARRIADAAAEKLIELAEEMDADDYGQ